MLYQISSKFLTAVTKFIETYKDKSKLNVPNTTFQNKSIDQKVNGLIFEKYDSLYTFSMIRTKILRMKNMLY